VKFQWADSTMALSNFAGKMLLLESANLKLKRRKNNSQWFHELNEERNSLGELIYTICTWMQDFIPICFMNDNKYI
jgi:hypothetical protein